MMFNSIDEAQSFLLQSGAKEEDLYYYKFVDENDEEVWQGKEFGNPLCISPKLG
jgi:hypothetical protein